MLHNGILGTTEPGCCNEMTSTRVHLGFQHRTLAPIFRIVCGTLGQADGTWGKSGDGIHESVFVQGPVVVDVLLLEGREVCFLPFLFYNLT